MNAQLTVSTPPLNPAAWQPGWSGIPPRARAEAPALPHDPLTPREREVVRLLVQGLSNRQVGERLNVAMGTVRKHRENLMGKLEVHDLGGLQRWAAAVGLLAQHGESAASLS